MQDLTQPQRTISKLAIRPLGATIALLAGLTFAQPARASCAIGVIPGDTLESAADILSEALAAGMTIAYSLSTLTDAIVRLANSNAQNTETRNRARASQADARAVQETAGTVGKVRSTIAKEFVPSASLCGEVSAQRRLGMTGAMYASYRTQLQSANTNFSSGGPGTKAEKGTVQGLANLWVDRCNKYADLTKIQTGGYTLPAGVCAGATNAALKDLDIQPWKALLDPVQFPNADRETAASDSIAMLTEISPPDHVRGPALLRAEGKNLHVLRMRDITRMNLARGVLEDIAAMRKANPGGGIDKSRLARYFELITCQTFNTATGELTKDISKSCEVNAAKETENNALQLASSRLATQQGMMFEIMRLSEQLIALEAVELAIKVEKSRSKSGASSAGSSMQRQ
jgi:hypothetical protein